MATAVAPLTLYTNKGCPYAQRAVIALKETKIPYDAVEIDLQNKPVWYQPNINPASKVPAIVYGATQADKTVAPPNTTKLAESLVLVEFFADLVPSSHLLPSDPVERAKARFFITLVGDKFNPAWQGLAAKGEGEEAVLAAVKQIAGELDPQGPYALGKEWTIADTAIAPFVGRLYLIAKEDIGAWEAGTGPKLLQQLEQVPHWDRYAKALLARDSYKESFPTEYLSERLKERFAAQRK
ncbi:glutathione S-transferase C-terminal-like protein [Dacryopinax primogenitus]|uniref:Glutathione S-transferase C-terminal-like protein n=1 Tax=Dacryopinax primogenitus (strain DJM 731) TaxID=1858805 RepID=M5GFK6_DACPD|nr:glutathione S-transferase C-terminal-like protein [Dacryopinax primogenitus]EJU04188.1 glutathione S-transferase C-terminal-like protein [Dacryopinax primogenitus]